MERTRTGILAWTLLCAVAPAMADDPPTEGTAAPEPAELAVIPVVQEQAPTPPESPVALDTIEVTAQRKVASLQETPISLEVFNAEKLSLRGIDGLAGLAANVPALTVEPFPTHNGTLRMFIRGVGTADAQVTQDPAVGVYLDGVYIARSVGLAVDTADLERVEVLRGPQGTLYGRNTTGGAINLVTRRPQPGVFTMTHQPTAGGRGLYLGRSSFNIPVAEDLAVKLAVLGSTRDGFVENTGDGGDFSDRREQALRFDARWLAGDWLTADYSYDRTDKRYFNGQFQAVVPPYTNHGLAEYFKAYAQTQTVYSDRRLGSLATGRGLEACRSKIDGHGLMLSVPFEGLELKYIGSRRNLTDDEYVDLGGGAGSTTFRLDTQSYDGPAADAAHGGPTPLVIPQVFQQQTSHELQISGALFDGAVEFVAGVYRFEEDGGEHGGPLHHILNAPFDPQAGDIQAITDAAAGLTSPNLVAFWDYEFAIHNTAEAAFAQVTWTPRWLDHRLHLTGGVRESRDERAAVKSFIQRVYVEGRDSTGAPTANEVPRDATPGNDVFDNVHAASRYRDFSPSANVQFDFTQDLVGYVSSARAYKSGGFNLRDPQIDGNSGPASDDVEYGFGFVEGFKPEIVQSYELGVKSEWFGRRLRFNADVFDSRFTDMQTNFLISGTISDTKSRNVGKARMRGFEMDAAYALWQGMIASLSYAWLDARVIEILDIEGDNVAHLYPFVSAPPHSGVASLDWTFADFGWGQLRAFASYNYMGHRDGLVITEPRRGLTALPAFGAWNTRLMLGGLRLGEHGMVDVALWGRNLADEEYEVFAIDNLPQADRAVLWGEPRNFGLDLVYRFF